MNAVKKTQYIFTQCPRLYFSWPNLLSSISTIFPGLPIFSERESTIVERERCPASSMAWVCGRCRTKSQVRCKILAATNWRYRTTSRFAPLVASGTAPQIEAFVSSLACSRAKNALHRSMAQWTPTRSSRRQKPPSLRPQEDAVVLRSYFVAMVV